MHELVARIKDPELCYVFARNAIRRGENSLALQAHRRAVDLKAEQYGCDSDVELLALKSFFAYEEALSWGQRKRRRATGTWQMVSRIGILPTLLKRLQGKGNEAVVQSLEDMQMTDYSFAAVAPICLGEYRDEAVA